MNPAEIYEIQAAIIPSINDLWEIWLGGTFAVIVAFHVGRHSITRPLLVTGCVLYSAASASICLRYAALISAFGAFNRQLLEAGYDIFPMPEWFIVPNFTITALIFFLGTIATVTFAITQYVKNQAERDS